MSELDIFMNSENKTEQSKTINQKDVRDIDYYVSGEYVEKDGMTLFIRTEEYTDIPVTNAYDNDLQIEKLPKWLLLYAKIYQKYEKDKVVFIDTETTGLDRGTTSFAFLTGLCYFRNEKWIMKQYFVKNQADELLLIEELKKVLKEFRTIVAFNGKCFDIPLLDNRMKYYSVTSSIRDLEVLDLMHISRRLWKEKLHGCKLQDLEICILDFSRDYASDIPGDLIPKTYFDYVNSGDAQEISSVFYHNELDLFSMVQLLSIITQIDSHEIDYLYANKIDMYGLAKLFYEYGLENDSEKLLLELINREEVSEKILLLYIKILKHKKRCKDILDVVDNYGKTSIDVLLEGAKVYEHYSKNYQAAFDMTKLVYLLLHEEFELNEKKIREVEKRITRLQRMLK